VEKRARLALWGYRSGPASAKCGAGAPIFWHAPGNCRPSSRRLLIPNRLFPVRRLQGTVWMVDRLAGQLEHYMDLLSVRQKLVASNIANVDTPGYRTQDIDFQTEFQSASGGAPRVVGVPGLTVKNDGNNVSLDREARMLSENALRFQMASNLLRGEITRIRSAINEGKTS
jgi:flagellar basal-body rod protein FlgB